MKINKLLAPGLFMIVLSCHIQLFSQATISKKGNDIPPKATLFGDYMPPKDATPEYRFKEYCRQLGEIDINVTKPTDYTPIRMEANSRRDFFRRFYHESPIYQIGLQSPDEKAVILFPMVIMNSGVQSLQQGVNIENDLRMFMCDAKLDIRPLIEIISEKDMSRFANADTAVIYSFELKEPYTPYMERYNHCVGVYLRKYGHPAMLLKLVLDDESYKDKDRYMRQMLDNIHYGDKETDLTPYENGIKKPDLSFPTARQTHNLPEDYEFGDSDYVRKRRKAENDSLNLLPWSADMPEIRLY